MPVTTPTALTCARSYPERRTSTSASVTTPALGPVAGALVAGALVAGAATLGAAAPANAATPPAQSSDWFESRVRPILVTHCEECHGTAKQKGGLRLDSREGWEKGGDSGPALVPGKPDESLLLKAVRHTDRDLQMPPKKTLATQEIAALEDWIRAGAPDPRSSTEKGQITAKDRRHHWAFRGPLRKTPPNLPGDDWSRNAIDRFVLLKLREAGLGPSPQADNATLLRRASYAITGLPPAFEEQRSLSADTSPQSLDLRIDALLESPRFGEHWARHWMDVARYSDTKGYVYGREERKFVHSSTYRDWLIRAFNENLPYDRFLLLQIAADQLVEPLSPDLAALGFLTLGRRFLGVSHDIIDDRIDVLMRGTLALTVACARCHDHKFDPISTREYYGLYGVFDSCSESVVPCGSPQNLPPAFFNEYVQRETKLRETLQQRREEQSQRVRERTPEYLAAQLELEKYPASTFGQILAPGDINPESVRAWQAFLEDDSRRNDPVFSAWHAFAQLPADGFAKGAGKTTETLLQRPASLLLPRIRQRFATPPESMREVARRYGALFDEVLAEWKKLKTAHPAANSLPDAEMETIRLSLFRADSPCSIPDESLTNIENFFPTSVVVELWKLQGEVDRWLVQSPECPPFAGILSDRRHAKTPRVFKRGNPALRQEAVSRGFLSILSGGRPAPFSEGSGRLELARSIAAKSNPLTARVAVNRVWMHYFGRGLVETPSDFGTRSPAPSHPELLDWLATELMSREWDLKHIHRLILQSATYRQSSFVPNDRAESVRGREADPENRLLWRMNTHRLEFEEMRDAWLCASEELELALGGRPPDALAAKNFRRTVYGFVDRERLPNAIRIFDFANPDLSIARRTETSVPQQALFHLNHAFVVERARLLASKAVRTGSDIASQTEFLYGRILQRSPTVGEGAWVRDFLVSQKEDRTDIMALQDLAQTLLLANEFLFID